VLTNRSRLDEERRDQSSSILRTPSRPPPPPGHHRPSSTASPRLLFSSSSALDRSTNTMSRCEKGAGGWLIAVACLIALLSASVALADAEIPESTIIPPSAIGQPHDPDFGACSSE
jgi:hypothetical protein